MENSEYDHRAKHILSEIKDLIEIKGIAIDSIAFETGISAAVLDQILSGEIMPSLTQFLALCEVSGITIKLPSVETPKNPMWQKGAKLLHFKIEITIHY